MSTGMEIQLLDVGKHKAVLLNQQEKLDKWCSPAASDVRGEALIRYALAELETNNDLRACTPTSIYLALLSCAVTGLVPGKLRGFSFLVPFNNTKRDGDKEYKVAEATFMTGWKGVKHIGYRAGLHLVSQVIHKNDKFDYDVGTNKFVTYKPALEGAGPVIGTAAWCELPRGGLEVEFLNLETLGKIQESAERMRPSPAWRGAFKDQMQRKSALKRLGKQVEMGEEFLKADAIEIAQDEHGDPSRALDEFTDGAATRFLGQQSAEAAAFGHLPRPAQAQVPATTGPAAPGETKLQAATDKARAADKGRAERPTAPASSVPPSSGAGSQAAQTSPASSPASSAAAANPTKAPATSSNGSVSPPASAATPAASLPPASTTTQTRPASTPAVVPASSASAPSDPSPQPQGEERSENVEPTEGDTSFDTSFFGDEDPVDRTPQTRADWVALFRTWSESHNTKATAQAGWPEFERIFGGWLAACTNKVELEEDKPVWTDWSKGLFARGRKADPAKKIEATPHDKEIIQMQDAFARRHKELP